MASDQMPYFRLLFTIFGLLILLASPALGLNGPLRVSPQNPRYFTDNSGQIIFLTGSHTWNNFQDWAATYPPPAFDFTKYLNFLQTNNHNFFRLWTWEQARWMPHRSADDYFLPNAYARTGPGTALDGRPKFDLTQFNQAYFDRLRQRIIQAGSHDIYTSVMLFEGWGVDKKNYNLNNPWRGHPYHASNNINGVNGDTNNDGVGTETHILRNNPVLTLQEAYVIKVIDTVNDLDNVLYEISNESDGCYDGGSGAWQNHMINLIKTYQNTKPKQHPVGFTVEWPCGDNSKLTSSNADWISPNGDINNPPTATGNKVVLLDTDHLCGICGDRYWVWKSFTRGHNPIFMDDYEMADWGTGGSQDWTNLRQNLGYAKTYANKLDLRFTTPQSSLSTTGYALANPGVEYLVYQPTSGSFSVTLVAGTYTFEWFRPSTGTVNGSGSVTVSSGSRSFTPPSTGDAVLYLKTSAQNPTPTPLPTATPAPAPPDLNGDGQVNIFDLNRLVNYITTWGFLAYPTIINAL